MQVVDCYCRVSTDSQEENSSLDEQERQCREFCQQHGLTIGMVHHESHTGYEYRERKKLTLMRERWRSGLIQGVVVRTLDRLSRDYTHYAILMEEREHYGVAIYAVKDDIGREDTKMDKFVQMVLAFVADMERTKIIDRTIDGRIAMARQGKIVGGKNPRYGWQWHDAILKDYLVINEEEAAIVRWAAEAYANGTSATELAKNLMDRHIPSPSGNGLWQTRSLLRLLTDERNIGKGAQFTNPVKKAKRNLDPVPLPLNVYPPILDEETYQLILERTKVNQAEAARHGSDPEHYLLRAGFVKCPICKRNMLGLKADRTHKGTTRRNYLYVCQRSLVCNGYRVQAADLDNAVWGELVQLADHISLIEEAVRLATNRDNSQANLKAVERALAEWRDKADTFNDDLQDTRLKGPTRAALRKSLDDALEMVERLEGERKKLLAGEYDRQKEREAYNEILEWCRTVKTAREPLSYTKKRDFLRLLGAVVYVNHVPRKKSSPISYDIKLRLPALQELVGVNQSAIACPIRTSASRNDTFFVGIKNGVYYINPALQQARSA